ncbi:Late embryogenis abundant protein 41, partial [Mucuna pruriens]
MFSNYNSRASFNQANSYIKKWLRNPNVWCASSHIQRELRGGSCCGSILGQQLSQQQTDDSNSIPSHGTLFLPSQTRPCLRSSSVRRSYAVVSDASSVRGGLDRIGSRRGMVVGKVEEKSGFGASSSWAPDPVTGYYRPINHSDEIDPVELRQMLLNRKVRSSSSSSS